MNWKDMPLAGKVALIYVILVLFIVFMTFFVYGGELGYSGDTHGAVTPWAEVSGNSKLAFNSSVYSYTVYIATLSYKTPQITEDNVTSVFLIASQVPWVSISSSGLMTVNPPPYLPFSASTGNYGTYNVTLQATAIADSTGTTLNSTAYAMITVIIFPQVITTNVTQATRSIFPQLTTEDIFFGSVGIVSVVAAVLIMVYTADRKSRREQEEKYEKEWLKHD